MQRGTLNPGGFTRQEVRPLETFPTACLRPHIGVKVENPRPVLGDPFISHDVRWLMAHGLAHCLPPVVRCPLQITCIYVQRHSDFIVIKQRTNENVDPLP